MIKATLMVPNNYLEIINTQARERRGELISTKFVDQNNTLMEIRYPLSEIITDFYDELKVKKIKDIKELCLNYKLD